MQRADRTHHEASSTPDVQRPTREAPSSVARRSGVYRAGAREQRVRAACARSPGSGDRQRAHQVRTSPTRADAPSPMCPRRAASSLTSSVSHCTTPTSVVPFSGASHDTDSKQQRLATNTIATMCFNHYTTRIKNKHGKVRKKEKEKEKTTF